MDFESIDCYSEFLYFGWFCVLGYAFRGEVVSTGTWSCIINVLDRIIHEVIVKISGWFFFILQRVEARRHGLCHERCWYIVLFLNIFIDSGGQYSKLGGIPIFIFLMKGEARMHIIMILVFPLSKLGVDLFIDISDILGALGSIE